MPPDDETGAFGAGLLPWFVKISPEFYDDDLDVGFGWEGWARSEADAVRRALVECHDINERDPETRSEDVDPERAKVHVVEVDFRRFAGPLLHWARATGNADSPMWQAMEYAVAESKLVVAPFELIEEL